MKGYKITGFTKEELEVYIKHTLKLVKEQVGDPTVEVCKLTLDGKPFHFKAFTKEQWKSTHKKVNRAEFLFGKHYNGYPKPNFLVTVEDEEYYIKVVK